MASVLTLEAGCCMGVSLRGRLDGNVYTSRDVSWKKGAVMHHTEKSVSSLRTRERECMSDATKDEWSRPPTIQARHGEPLKQQHTPTGGVCSGSWAVFRAVSALGSW